MLSQGHRDPTARQESISPEEESWPESSGHSDMGPRNSNSIPRFVTPSYSYLLSDEPNRKCCPSDA